VTRALAVEWGPLASASTPSARVRSHRPDAKAVVRTDHAGVGIREYALQRLGQPEDMVGTTSSWPRPAASFMTGQTIYVDGGFTAGWTRPIPKAAASKTSRLLPGLLEERHGQFR
jgi:NAD(P)-dependent dehydrogenase (short-subunit alcohol dehydrogenase family)